MSRVSAVLAEDEAPQREALVELLGELWPELELCAVCEDGLSALEALAAHRPQLAILDIRMPGLSGLEVARSAIAGGARVLFTTAYDEYAVRAFEAGAVDYVLKPLRRDRLELALERVRERLQQRQAPSGLPERLGPAESGTLQWITAQLGDSVRLVGIEEVLYFQSQDKLTRVVTGQGEALIRTPLKELVAQLDSQQFWQVHRSVVVRVAQIRAFEKNELGRHELCLRDRPERLPVAQAFAARLRSM
ncbi:LytR/AlgR family response regulator transcription factor [Pseudomarimonas salicorniae]|uniref:LytTR family DNA-binding domain-containing protein n=1 Tax=Pseudomarimonas salicorniae TaxID=2933270 RepID=A0ABT0GFU9_9GAMM|nr:LytTR family DNA-binding domain-containing protein [Lysobacter sp. CAU 1642]MCK7593421.1 LytTR family DNA-binding domain-containing protein [Lysobacter sp. CAU 1642]